MADVVLRFDRVVRYFGGLTAVNECTFEISEGELVGLVGPNGAGKSSVFNLASGYLSPSRGSVTVVGRTTSGAHPADLARSGVGRTFQTPVAFRDLSVLDNVLVAAPVHRPLLSGLLGMWRGEEKANRTRALHLLDRVGLSDRADDLAAELSGGELRMLEVARQLFASPKLLLLDEPTAGVAPALQDNLAELIRSVNQDGVTVVVVEHNLGFLLQLVDRVICMANGSVIADGPPQQVRDDPDVIAAYRGDET